MAEWHREPLPPLAGRGDGETSSWVDVQGYHLGMDRHDHPHDHRTCPRCIELRRQEFVVPDEEVGVVPGGMSAFLRSLQRPSPGIVHRWVDPIDHEQLWGEPPPA